MLSLSVVIANRDAQAASQLAASLNTYCRNVSVARSLDEVRNAIPKHRAQLAILDLELASVEDIGRLAPARLPARAAAGRSPLLRSGFREVLHQ